MSKLQYNLITAIAAHQAFCSAKPFIDDIPSPGMPSIKLGIVLSELEEDVGGGDKFPNPWAIKENNPFRVLKHFERGGTMDAGLLRKAVAQTTTFKLKNLQQ